MFSGKWVFFIATMISIVGTVLSPLAAKEHWSILVVLRVIEGFGGGASMPAVNVIISKWAPKDERSTMTSICMGGTIDKKHLMICLNQEINPFYNCCFRHGHWDCYIYFNYWTDSW